MLANRLTILLSLVTFMELCSPRHFLFAGESTTIEKLSNEETRTPIPAEIWASEVNARYHLTPDQIHSLDRAEIRGMARLFVAVIAKHSGKAVDQIIDSRTTEQLGWEATAKKYGVSVATLSSSVAQLRKEIRQDEVELKMKAQQEMKQARRADAERAEKRSRSTPNKTKEPSVK